MEHEKRQNGSAERISRKATRPPDRPIAGFNFSFYLPQSIRPEIATVAALPCFGFSFAGLSSRTARYSLLDQENALVWVGLLSSFGGARVSRSIDVSPAPSYQKVQKSLPFENFDGQPAENPDHR